MSAVRLLGGPLDGLLAGVDNDTEPAAIRVRGDVYRRTPAGDRTGRPVYLYDATAPATEASS